MGRTAGAAFSKLGSASKKVLDSEKVRRLLARWDVGMRASSREERVGLGELCAACRCGACAACDCDASSGPRARLSPHTRQGQSFQHEVPATPSAAAGATTSACCCLHCRRRPPARSRPLARPPAAAAGPSAHAPHTGLPEQPPLSRAALPLPAPHAPTHLPQVSTATGAVGSGFKKLGASLSSLTGRKKEGTGEEVVPQVRARHIGCLTQKLAWVQDAAGARLKMWQERRGVCGLPRTAHPDSHPPPTQPAHPPSPVARSLCMTSLMTRLPRSSPSTAPLRPSPPHPRAPPRATRPRRRRRRRRAARRRARSSSSWMWRRLPSPWVTRTASRARGPRHPEHQAPWAACRSWRQPGS